MFLSLFILTSLLISFSNCVTPTQIIELSQKVNLTPRRKGAKTQRFFYNLTHLTRDEENFHRQGRNGRNGGKVDNRLKISPIGKCAAFNHLSKSNEMFCAPFRVHAGACFPSSEARRKLPTAFRSLDSELFKMPRNFFLPA